MTIRALFRRLRLRLPMIEPEDLDPVLRPDDLGPTPAAESVVLAGRVAASTTDYEAWLLAVLAKSAHRLFEFGTATGRTTYLWARNSPPDAEVITLTLPPHAHDAYTHSREDSRRDQRHALRESRFSRFRYQGTAVEHKVTQLFGDSKDFDETPFLERCDLIFVDGSHAYSYVRNDSEKALRMLTPGGLLLWHDYGRARGVTRYLHELARSYPIRHVRGTSLAAFRAPAAPGPAGSLREAHGT